VQESLRKFFRKRCNEHHQQWKNSKKTAALATIVGLAAVIPAMFGGLINVGVSDVNVLSAD
jgi:hypothetical protein